MDNQVRNKRICFVTTISGTLKAFVFPQAINLLQNGWDVTFICAEDKRFFKDIPNGVRYIPLPFKRGIDPFGAIGAILKLYRIFKRERFDIVQYSTPNAAFYSSIAARYARIPVRLYAQWGIRYVGFSGVIKSFFKQIERWCCKYSTIIEPDSLSNYDLSVREGLYTRDKARVIWNGSACGVNLEHFDISKKDAWRLEYRKKMDCDSHHKVIGFVGSIRRDKGINELLSACRMFFNKMPDVRLLLVGEKQFYDTIEKKLRDWMESSEQIIYVPPTNQVPKYMACMDIFAMPSYREGFGVVIIEAAAMGVPAVVSDVPGPIDAVRHEETGLIVPVKNVNALSAALQILLKDPDKLAACSAGATKFARDNFEQKEFLQHVLIDKEQLIVESRP